MKIYNSLTGKKEDFNPLIPNKVNIYTCGVTVYDHCHIGHARSAIVFDVMRRYLNYKGFDVTYVRNFTDIDDKIINRANRRKAFHGMRLPENILMSTTKIWTSWVSEGPI